MRRKLGYPSWSLSAWLKQQVKDAVKAIDCFETALAGAAWMAWSAAISTTPKCAWLTASDMRNLCRVLIASDFIRRCVRDDQPRFLPPSDADSALADCGQVAE